VLVEDIEQAKEYTRIRREKTKREIKDEAFDKTVIGIRKNLKNYSKRVCRERIAGCS